MKQFIDENFLLSNKVAEELYHDHAAHQPIIDYHNHLPPKDIAENRQFADITEAWLEGDHYKWRAMRANGIDESYITGDRSHREKFLKWAETVPYTLRNPLYHWTHLELKRYFGINELLDKDTASSIYTQTQEEFALQSNSCRGLLENKNVEVVCTTDDPVDDLQWHQEMSKSGFTVKVYPTFRPDKVLNVTDPKAFKGYMDLLSKASGVEINGLDNLFEAFQRRIDFFHYNGCRLSDHGLAQLPLVVPDQNPQKVFNNLLRGKIPETLEAEALKSTVLLNLSRMYHAKNWTQQFHLGPLRNTNSRAFRNLGPDTGFDSMGDFEQGTRLMHFLDTLDSTNQLAKTILYNLNPKDNALFATMIGNFQDGRTAGKMQFGSGWWFLDQKGGIENQLNAISNMGLLSRFVGMLTDSRSFLSFPRHEYFRRILCNLIGQDVVNDELPNDIRFLGGMVEDICYHNAKTYFNFNNCQ